MNKTKMDKIMKKGNIWIWMVLIITFIGYSGCSDINELHDQYLQRGETVYMGRHDSVKIFSGQNRVFITYRNYDPKVGKLTVYWDFRQGSATFYVPADKLGEDLEVEIDQLEEKQYTFELVTSTPEGKFSSIPLNITANVYGPKFEASASNRKIFYATNFPFAHRKTINWASTVEDMVGVELKYRNESDAETVLKIPNDERITRITDYKEDDVIMYRTLHSPENCIDTFYTAYTPINLALVEEEKLNRALFSRWNPPGIPYQSFGGWEIESMWDGNLGDVDPGFSSPSGNNIAGNPWNFTFDMGQTAKIRRFVYYPRLTANQAYTANHLKKVEFWGSPTSDVNADFDTWLFLGEFNSVKPSGEPLPVITQEDIDYARGGEEFFTTHNTTEAVRYIRVRVLEMWVMPNNTVQIMELEIFGDIQEE